MRIAVLLFTVVLTACHRAPTDLAKHFKDFDGAFVLHELHTGRTIRYNEDRCATRLTPCSTFKIPHALIALETGVTTGPDHLRVFDAQRYPNVHGSWAQDQTQASAMRRSAVWYFQETAREIGQTRMAEHLAQLNYGNQSLAGGIDRFWLDEGLAVSANEQVAFLTRLYRNNLPYQPKHMAAVRDMILLEQSNSYTLYGKTGSNGRGLGRLVGFVTRGDKVFIFAYNADLPEDKAGVKHRLRMVKAILRDLQVLPLTAPISYRAPLQESR